MVRQRNVLLLSDVRLMMLQKRQFLLQLSISPGLVAGQADTAADCSILRIIFRICRSSASVHLPLKFSLFLLNIPHSVRQFQQRCLSLGHIGDGLRSNIDPNRSFSDGVKQFSGFRVPLHRGPPFQHQLRIPTVPVFPRRSKDPHIFYPAAQHLRFIGIFRLLLQRQAQALPLNVRSAEQDLYPAAFSGSRIPSQRTDFAWPLKVNVFSVSIQFPVKRRPDLRRDAMHRHTGTDILLKVFVVRFHICFEGVFSETGTL